MPDRTGPSAIRVDSMRTAFMVMRRSNQSLTRCLRVITQDPPVGWLLDPPRRGEEARSVLLLTRADASVLAIVGAGVQARSHARTVTRVRDFSEIRIAGRDRMKAETLADELADEGLPAVAADSVEAALRGADVVCATTHAREPVI